MYEQEDFTSTPTTVSTCTPYTPQSSCPHCDDTGTVVVHYEDGDIEHHDCSCTAEIDESPSFIDPSIFEPEPKDFDAEIEAILAGRDDGDDWSFYTRRPAELSRETHIEYSLDDVPDFDDLAA